MVIVKMDATASYQSTMVSVTTSPSWPCANDLRFDGFTLRVTMGLNRRQERPLITDEVIVERPERFRERRMTEIADNRKSA